MLFHSFKFLVSRLKNLILKREVFVAKKDLFTRVSRFFRPLFEQKRIKAILGGNLALLVLTTSIFSPKVSALSSIPETEVTALSAGAVELTTQVVLRAPVDKISITQRFSFFHSGVDFDGITGDPVYPIMKGRIEAIIYDRFNLGNHIIINHGSGLKSISAHLSKILVSLGDEVDTNTVIGKIGSSGRAFGDHLHFEVIDNGRYINPLSIIPL